MSAGPACMHGVRVGAHTRKEGVRRAAGRGGGDPEARREHQQAIREGGKEGANVVCMRVEGWGVGSWGPRGGGSRRACVTQFHPQASRMHHSSVCVPS